jgi:hypothetical protein
VEPKAGAPADIPERKFIIGGGLVSPYAFPILTTPGSVAEE